MKVLKKGFILLAMICVLFMCVGCSSFEKVERNLDVNKDGSGTYSTKLTFNKQYFEQSKYGKETSLKDYVDIVDSLVSKEYGFRFETDTTSNQQYSYVKINLDFNSINEICEKLNKMDSETARMYTTIKNDKDIYNPYKSLKNAIFGDSYDKTLQKFLSDNNVSYSINSDEYKILKYNLISNYNNCVSNITDLNKENTDIINKSNSESLANCSSDSDCIEIKTNKNGTYLCIYSTLIQQMDSYFYNLIYKNKDLFFDNNLLNNDSQTATETYLNEFINNKCEALKSIITSETYSDSNGNPLKYDLTVENMNRFLNQNNRNALGKDKITSNKLFSNNFYSYETIVDIENKLTSGYNGTLDKTGTLSGTIYGKYYSDLLEIANQNGSDVITIQLNSQNDTNESNTNNENSQTISPTDESLDDSPKTGDVFPIELICSLFALTLIVSISCAIYSKKALS